ncbi:aminotransferase class I/II-fold pyridoxal phosphate-dependent enzyme [Thalassotalea castellviae]|uniref:8-amino-7-oxononanoate synthase n=1 Tax=Thalassotalea castellviae TaxID=3075612 RepID=A0ABU2ZZA3_9GAMM|nr:8-amino-7-oxononanoate synthase [Thalassotalea sp. W431]MDT0602041.1 8-amino-7-oxononanoate synthase [Thalassotalea sp. W431]
MAFEYLAEQLAQQKLTHRFRQRQCIAKQQEANLFCNDKEYLNFSSNDYLGLNQHPDINHALQEGVSKFGVSSCSSSLVTGFSYAHNVLENTLCEWLNKPKCLLFNSGFSANHGLLSALACEQTQFWLDKLSHASLIDGALSGKAKVKRFLHNNYQQLEQLLLKKSLANNLIVSEGVFSMDGDQADINALQKIAQKHQAWLYLDDAHSLGIIGEKGQGSVSINPHVDIVMATFGKAVATSGAFIACDETLHDYLINFSRHYIYSTAMSPAIAWATNKSVEIIQKDNWRREKIAELSRLFAKSLNDNIEMIPTSSSIHAIIVGDEKKSLDIAEKLKAKGIWLTAIRPPTVPNGTSRLRVTICANHNKQDIKYLAENINKAIN